MRGNRKGCCLKKECYHRQGSRLVIRGNMKRTVPFAQEGSAGTPRSNSLVSSFGGCLAPRQDCFACKSVVHLSQMSHHLSLCNVRRDPARSHRHHFKKHFVAGHWVEATEECRCFFCRRQRDIYFDSSEAFVGELRFGQFAK